MARHPVPVKGIAVLAAKWVPSRISAADSSYTEADPLPGTAETTETYARLVPQLVGAQTQDGVLVVTRTGEPGIGMPSGLLRSSNAALNAALGPVHTAELGYYLGDGVETEDDARGYDPPIKITDWRAPAALPAPDAADAAMLPLSGKVALRWTCSTGVRFSVWDPYTETFENTTTFTGTRDAPGAVCCVPGTERILLVYATHSIYSDDYGASWGNYSRSGPVDYETELGTPNYAGKIRAAFDGQGNLLWAATELTTGDLHLYASSDLGASWTLNEVIDAAEAIDWDLAAHPDGTLLLGYIDATNTAKLARLGGAYSTLANAETVTVFSETYGGTFPVQQIWVAVEATGAIWVYAEDDVNEGWWRAAASVDDGETFYDRFAYPVIPYSFFWNAGDGSRSPGGWRLVPNAAGGLIAAACFGPVGAGVQQGGMAKLGGWTSPQPVQRQFGRVYMDGLNTHKDRHWVGYGRPEDTAGANDFSKTGTATTTHSSSDGSPVTPLGYVVINSGAGALAGYYEADLGDNGVIGAHGLFCLRVAEDGGSGQAIAIRYTLDDTSGNTSCQVGVHFTETGIRVRDHVAAAWFGAEIAHPMTARTWVSINIDMVQETVEILYRYDGTTKWERVLYDAVTFVNATTSTDLGHVEWGHLTGVANVVSRWWAAQAAQVIGIAEAPETDGESYRGTDVAGVSCGSEYGAPIPELWDAANERPCYLLLRGSVGVEGESYTHDTAQGYPIEAVFPTLEPSAERKWRTQATGVEQRLALDLGRDTRPGIAHSLLWLVAGANARYWRVSVKEDGGSSYTTLGTMDLATGFASVGFARYGEVVVPASGGAGSRYIAAGECAGGHIILDIGGTPVPRRVRTNTPGFFDPTAGPQATLLLEGVDGTEPSSGLATIVWPTGVLALHGALTSTAYRRYWRVSCLSTNESPDSYYEAGVIAPFALKPTGKQWGNGWEISYEPNARASRDARGTERRDQLGPNRRILTKTWDHGAKLDRIRGQTDADHIGVSGGPGLVARDDVWWQLEDVLRESDGGARPVLSVFTEIADGATINDPSLFLYGYVTGSIRTQHANGEDGVNEFVRSGPVRLEEIV